MTVPYITDDLLAEIEREARDDIQDAYGFTNCNPKKVLALIARVRELEKDVQEWKEVVSAVISESKKTNYGRHTRHGNAPGHGHSVPGIWDSDNGSKAGTECAWCMAWNKALKKVSSDLAMQAAE